MLCYFILQNKFLSGEFCSTMPTLSGHLFITAYNFQKMNYICGCYGNKSRQIHLNL